MTQKFYQQLQDQLAQVEADGLYKHERALTSAQQAEVNVAGDGEVINFCANNYLGLANHPALISAAKQGLDDYGFGMASVRFICGTQDNHHQLEAELSAFFGDGRYHPLLLLL